MRGKEVVVIVDTSVLQHLRDIVINGKQARSWLLGSYRVCMTQDLKEEIKVSNKWLKLTKRERGLVNRAEKLRGAVNSSLRSSFDRFVGNSSSKIHRTEMSELLGGFRAVSTQRTKSNTMGYVIIVSDDFEAFRSEASKEFLRMVPVVCHWTALDFLLYLASTLRNTSPSYDPGTLKAQFYEAVDSVVNKLAGGDLKKPDSDERQRNIKRWRGDQATYKERVDRIISASSNLV